MVTHNPPYQRTWDLGYCICNNLPATFQGSWPDNTISPQCGVCAAPCTLLEKTCRELSQEQAAWLSLLGSCLTSIREMLVLFTDASPKYLRDGHVASNKAANLSGTLTVWFLLPQKEAAPFSLTKSCSWLYHLLFSKILLNSMKITRANSDYKLLQVPPWHPWTEGQIDTSLWPFVFSCPGGTLRVTKSLSWEDAAPKLKLIDSKSHWLWTIS